MKSTMSEVFVGNMPDAVDPMHYPTLSRALRDARELLALLEQAKADGLKVRKWELEVAKRDWREGGHVFTTIDPAIAKKWKMRPVKQWGSRSKRLK
jgi:hypothetical protein